MAEVSFTFRKMGTTHYARALIIGVGALALWLVTGATGAVQTIDPSPTDLARAPIFRSCVNLGNALDAPKEGEWGFRIEPWQLDAIARAGFDAVRIPVRFSAHASLTPPFALDPQFLARVDELIGYARARHLKVIVDMHHYDAASDQPQTELARFRALWRQLSAHWKDQPDDLVLEILNEPHGAADPAWVKRFNDAALAQIRAHNPTRKVILATPFWGSFRGLQALASMDGLPRDPNVIASLHYYEPYDFTHQGVKWVDHPPPLGRIWGSDADRENLRRDFAQFADFGREHQTPIFLGEFGVNADVAPAQRALYLGAVRRAAEGAHMPHCVWAFAAGFDIWDFDRLTWAPGIQQALIGEPRSAPQSDHRANTKPRSAAPSSATLRPRFK